MGFPMKECWSGLLVPAPGDFSNTGIEPVSPAWQVDSLPLSHLGRSLRWRSYALSTSYYVIIFQCLEQYLTHRKCSINVSNYSYFSHTFVEKQNEWIKCLLKNLNISEWFPHGSPQSSFFSQGRFFFFFPVQNVLYFTDHSNYHNTLLVLEDCDSNCIFNDFCTVTLTTCLGSLWRVCHCILALIDGFCVSVVFIQS